ncbi:MAG: phasin family protein [Rhodospirillales bacterium]|nr:phasin family protein [Rhodospirillales bacterium]MSP79955.1 phasin family protein [Rhodospirillales bacterium]
MQNDFFKSNPFFGPEAFKNTFSPDAFKAFSPDAFKAAFSPEAFKGFAQASPVKMADEFFKAARQYRFAPPDMEALMESQRRNLEAFSAASRVVSENVQKIAKRQAEMVKESFDEMSAALSEIGKSGTFEEATAKQATFAKAAYETALDNSREIAEMVTETNEAVAEPISARVSTVLDEMKEGALKLKTKPKKSEKSKAA